MIDFFSKIRPGQIREILDESSHAIIITDKHANIDFWNKGAQEIFGWHADEAIGKELSFLLADSNERDFARKIHLEILSGNQWKGFFKVKRKDDIFFKAHISGNAYYDDQLNVLGMISIAFPFNDGERLREDLKASRELNKAILNISPNILYIYDLELLEDVWVNEAYKENLFPYIENNKDGSYFNGVIQLIHKGDIKKFEERTKYFLNHDNSQTIEFRIKLGGKWHYFKDTARVFKRKVDGSIQQILGSINDITKEREAEAFLARQHSKLDHLNKRLQLAMEVGREGMWELDSKSRKLIFEPMASKMMGFGAKELKKEFSWFINRIHPVHKKAFEKIFGDFVNSINPSFELEFQLLHKRGNYFWVKGIGRFFSTDKKGKIKKGIGVIRNIDKEKQGEKELGEKNAYISLINENITDVLWQLDKDFIFRYISPSSFNLMGYYPEEVIGSSLFDYFAYETNNPLEQDIYDIAVDNHKRGPILDEYFLKRKDGRIISVEVNYSPIYLDGHLAGFSGVTRDISLRKKMEKELVASASQMKSMLENTDDYFMLADERGFPIHYNANYQRMIKAVFGIDVDSGLKPHSLLQDKKMVDFWDSCHERALSGEKFRIEYSMDFQGEERTFEFLFNPIFEKGLVTGFSEHSREVTKLKNYQKDLENARNKALESDSLKSAFLANLSHEIRTPMNGIMGFSRLLMKKGLSISEQKKYLNIIMFSGRRLMRLMEDIIDISRIEAGVMKKNASWCSLSKILENVNDTYSHASEIKRKKNLQFSVINKAGDENDMIFTDETRLRQIIDNLLNNGIKNTESGQLTLSCEVDTEGALSVLLFKVSDTGCGISPENQKKIFQRFVQLGDSSHKSGAGLGLSISKALAELLGGELWLDSNPGKGSTFYFTHPLFPRESVKLPDTYDSKTNFALNELPERTILYADTEITSFYLLKEQFKKTPFHVVHNRERDEIHKALSKGQADALILDTTFDNGNSLKLLNEIRTKHKALPIFIQSPFYMSDEKEQYKAVGSDFYFCKSDVQNILLHELVKVLYS